MSHGRTLAQPIPLLLVAAKFEVEGKEDEMNSAVALAVCAQYEILLKECEAALEAWDERREQFAQSHLSGKEVGDEMLRLQADYAKAYTALRKHVSKCAICQFYLRNSTEESEYDRSETSRRMPA